MSLESKGLPFGRLAAENERRYVALRDFFLRLVDEIFGLRQDFPDHGDLAAVLKQARLAQNPLPEAVLSLSLQAVKDAVLGLLPPYQLPADRAAQPPEARLPAQQSPTQPPPTPSRETKEEAAGPSSAGAVSVPWPLEASAAAEVLAILGGESAGRGGGVELVESLEPLRTSLCDQRLPPYSVWAGSVAVVDTEVSNSVLLLSARRPSLSAQPLRVTFPPEGERVMKTERVSGTNWDQRIAGKAVSIGGRVYIAGGVNDGRTLADVFVLGGSAEAAVLPAMRTGRSRHALLAFQGGLVAVGGLSGAKEPLASVESLRPDEAGAEWRALPDLPRPLVCPGAAAFKGRLFVAGGSDGRGVCWNVYSLGPQTERWEKEGRLSHGRCNVSLVVFKGRLFALGGICGPKGSNESWARSVEVFEERGRCWRLLPGRLRLPVDGSLAFPLRS